MTVSKEYVNNVQSIPLEEETFSRSSSAFLGNEDQINQHEFLPQSMIEITPRRTISKNVVGDKYPIERNQSPKQSDEQFPTSRNESVHGSEPQSISMLSSSLFSSAFSSTPAPISHNPNLMALIEGRNSRERGRKKYSRNNDDRRKQYPNHFEQSSPSTASLVVCTVDGTVLTLDAYSGQLRGMFVSGPALVFSSGAVSIPIEKDELDNQCNVEDTQSHVGCDYDTSDSKESSLVNDNSITMSQKLRHWEESIVPGLDGSLYSLLRMGAEEKLHDFNDITSESPKSELDSDHGDSLLRKLSISVMDVIDSPFSTCGYNENGADSFEELKQRQQKQCGIVFGSKSTTIYAIDPMTGELRWTKNPSIGRGAEGISTKSPRKSNSFGKSTVLLQREDYVVKQLDTDEGEEVWKVEFGRFSPLEFDMDAHHRQFDPKNSWGLNDEQMTNEKSPTFGTTRKKPFAFSEEYVFDREEAKYNNFDHERSHVLVFPSISFGEDGRSIIAVDGITREILWKRPMNSVVAAVYGVGKGSSWIELNVIQESEVFSHDRHNTESVLQLSVLPSILPKGGSVATLFSDDQAASNQILRLMRDHSQIFVATPFSEYLVEDNVRNNGLHFIDEHSGRGNTYQPKPAPVILDIYPDVVRSNVKPFLSYRTEHGPYLTWLTALFTLLIIISSLLISRVTLLRQKNTRESIVAYSSSASNSNSEKSTGHNLKSLRGICLPPMTRNHQLHFSEGRYWKEAFPHSGDKAPPPARTLSLDAIYRPVKYAAGRLTGDNVRVPIISQELSSPAGFSFVNETVEHKSLMLSSPATATALSTSCPLTVPDTTSHEKSNLSVIDNIDGIPLIRYSRYRSEFKELSALGEGGFGTVFRCENAIDRREYAIKKIWIKSKLGLDGKVTKQFSQKLHRVLREVKILALLDHPNIVRYYTSWLELDDGKNIDKDESSTTDSMFSTSFSNDFGSDCRSKISRNNIILNSGKGYSFEKNLLQWNPLGSLRVDESKSTGKLLNVYEDLVLSQASSNEEDLGFVWERCHESNINVVKDTKCGMIPRIKESSLNKEVIDSKSNIPYIDGGKAADAYKCQQNQSCYRKENQPRTLSTDPKIDETIISTSHVLYIQMQLCSVQTLADFLRNRNSRIRSVSLTTNENDRYAIDIPLSLRLFSQIVNGVKYVHKKGLIHRDLKPQNCFIDDAGNVKVGDFGLSRESSTAGVISAFVEGEGIDHSSEGCADNTAGIGTRTYASPEQIRGSKYDESTDVYSLGIILFEVCYPLYTTHERYKEFNGIKTGNFPCCWNYYVKKSFPSLHDILVRMISSSPSKRPSASDVSDAIDILLGEYSVQSLDKSWGKKGAILLRVETEESEGVLANAMKLIKDAAPNAIILQYGLRGQASKAIMEFAMELTDDAKIDSIEKMSLSLRRNDMVVRQISHH